MDLIRRLAANPRWGDLHYIASDDVARQFAFFWWEQNSSGWDRNRTELFHPCNLLSNVRRGRRWPPDGSCLPRGTEGVPPVRPVKNSG